MEVELELTGDIPSEDLALFTIGAHADQSGSRD